MSIHEKYNPNTTISQTTTLSNSTKLWTQGFRCQVVLLYTNSNQICLGSFK